MTRFVRTTLVAGMLFASGCVAFSEQRFISAVKNKSAPDFELKALDGSTVKLGDFRGKPVVLAFFALG